MPSYKRYKKMLGVVSMWYAKTSLYSIKKYGDLYKFTVSNAGKREKFKDIPSEWLEDELPPWPTVDGFTQGELPNVEKLDNSLSRTKNMVYDLALSNNWSWFCTFTINKQKYDRYNLTAYYKEFARWLYDYNRYKMVNGNKIAYLLIPEMHEDGAWHLHGFFEGLPESHLSNFPASAPSYLRDNGYLNWLPYSDKFGFCSFGHLRNTEAAGGYIMKYIGKGFKDRAKELGVPLYYRSKGLKVAAILKRGQIMDRFIEDYPFAFQNEYVRSCYLTYEELQALEQRGIDIEGL